MNIAQVVQFIASGAWLITIALVVLWVVRASRGQPVKGLSTAVIVVLLVAIGLSLIGAGLAGVTVAVGKVAWDAGAKALKEQAGGAKTSVDLLGEAVNNVGKALGTAAAPAVDRISGSLAIMIANMTNAQKSVDQLRLDLERLKEMQGQGGTGGQGGVIQTSYGAVPGRAGGGYMYDTSADAARAAANAAVAAKEAELRRAEEAYMREAQAQSAVDDRFRTAVWSQLAQQ